MPEMAVPPQTRARLTGRLSNNLNAPCIGRRQLRYAISEANVVRRGWQYGGTVNGYVFGTGIDGRPVTTSGIDRDWRIICRASEYNDLEAEVRLS